MQRKTITSCACHEVNNGADFDIGANIARGASAAGNVFNRENLLDSDVDRPDAFMT
jgi:hypothetical protein